MLKKDSAIIKSSSAKYHINEEVLNKYTEGMVIKKLDGKLTYPWITKEVSNFFKLRKADCINSSKKGILLLK
jgi:hypothetical protein